MRFKTSVPHDNLACPTRGSQLVINRALVCINKRFMHTHVFVDPIVSSVFNQLWPVDFVSVLPLRNTILQGLFTFKTSAVHKQNYFIKHRGIPYTFEQLLLIPTCTKFNSLHFKYFIPQYAFLVTSMSNLLSDSYFIDNEIQNNVFIYFCKREPTWY